VAHSDCNGVGSWLRSTRQRSKALAFGLSAVMLVVGFAGMLMTDDGDRRMAYIAVFLVSLLSNESLRYWIRCRACGAFVGKWAWEQRNMFAAMFRLQACPECGATGDSLEIRPPPAKSFTQRRPAFSLEHIARPTRRTWLWVMLVGALLGAIGRLMR